MGRVEPLLNRNTPAAIALDSRGMPTREISYQRHPDTLDQTEVRITRHHFTSRATLSHSTDPRLADNGLNNFVYHHDLRGNRLQTCSVDAGTSIELPDIAGRSLSKVSNIDCVGGYSQHWLYQEAALSGRVVAVSDQATGEVARTTERFVYADNSRASKDRNLTGQCTGHYDTVGLQTTERFSLCGPALSISRRLAKAADDPDLPVAWPGEDVSEWNALLADATYITLTEVDSVGSRLLAVDAAGHHQRVTYNIAGKRECSWLTIKDSAEQPIVMALTYSAAGQILSEPHANGVTRNHTYQASTQRLTGISTRHHSALLQDLRYVYDPVGNVSSVDDLSQEIRIWRNQRVLPRNRYHYDSLYQLVSASGREVAKDDGGEYTHYRREYRHDTGGNLVRLRHIAADTQNSYTTVITVSDQSNRGVLDVLAQKPPEVEPLFSAGGHQRYLYPGQSLAWTVRGELREVTPVVREGGRDDRENYRYAANNQRVLKGSTQIARNIVHGQRALYLPGLELRTRVVGDAQAECLQVIGMDDAQVRVLHWTGGKPAGIENDQIRYSYGDLLSSSGLEVDGDGNLISREEYYPYGATAVWLLRNAMQVDYKTVRYSGKERDATGLYYYGYRYYQPWIGRWLSPDPAGTVDGLNLYRMVQNNPITYIDVMGLQTRDTLIAEGLSHFVTGEQRIVRYALWHAKLVLEHASKFTDSSYRSPFFADLTPATSPKVQAAIKFIGQALNKYSAESGDDYFARASNPDNPNLMATMGSDDNPHQIRIFNLFFDSNISDTQRAATIIHELSHLKKLKGSDIRGPDTHDYFYLNDDDPTFDTTQKVSLGNLKKTDLKESDFFAFKVGLMYNAREGDPTEALQDYGVTLFNSNPSIRGLIAEDNADNIAYGIIDMARQQSASTSRPRSPKPPKRARLNSKHS
ncbi:RHS repeat-associated core domain-containing protein [Pseudomonas putida]|uniref:RHS repeat-associated core domain-containing protein n=1 Tax=Pseudomonas putida TaxID=303 RepID=UPI000855DA51|nr:RHS repeat-associated core domain-containing protein [Pseudomonas putida]OCT39303.1 hypothetical protein A6E19_06950 [Pseudomonas putida]